MSDKLTTSEHLFGNIGTCWEVPIDALTNPDRPLIPSQIRAWASLEADMSYKYNRKELPPSSQFRDGDLYITEVMRQLDSTFLHDFTDFNVTYMRDVDFAEDTPPDFTRGGFRKFFRARLEDPGMLHHAVYFGIADDPTTVSFYWHAWQGNHAKATDFLHGFGWDLYGKCRKVDEKSTWHHLNAIEGMYESERIKISDYASRVRALTAKLQRLPRITSFSGGNLPERHYGLPEAKITVFDTGKKSPMEQLFPNPVARERVCYTNDSLMTTIEHPELFGTQDVVTMFGSALHLHEAGTIQALSFGEALLCDKGILVFDLLVQNESLRRITWTEQPTPQTEVMVCSSAGTAMSVGMDIINTVNERLEKKRVIFTTEPPLITKVGAWGETGVRFYLKKHIL